MQISTQALFLEEYNGEGFLMNLYCTPIYGHELPVTQVVRIDLGVGWVGQMRRVNKYTH